jgi:uncharacterized protein (DUF362 family)
MGRLARAGATIAAAGAAGWWFYDPHGPVAEKGGAAAERVLDYAVAGAPPMMSIAHGARRAQNLASAIDALGGMSAFIRGGDRVLVKVNAAFATPPSLSATTHPELLSALIRLCFESGAASVVVTDNPINDPASCFALTGIQRAARDAGAELQLPGERAFQPLTVPGCRLLQNWPVLLGPFEGVTKLIGVAPVKDHHRSGASMTIKNWYGLLGGRRSIFHQDIHTIIQELAMMVRPTLVVLDGTQTMIRNGPTGGSLSDLEPTGTLIVSTDQVAADAYGAQLLGKAAAQLPHLEGAASRGAGTVDFQSLNPIEISG